MRIKSSGWLFLLCLLVMPFLLLGQSQNSRSGDEAALEVLYQSTNGSGWANSTGWSASGMSLSDNIYGVTVATINGELRVTKIDLRHNGLTGSIAVPEIGNLKQMTLFAVYGNSLHSQIPPELMSLTKLEYLYLSLADPYGKLDTIYPHELAQQGGGDVHTGKYKHDENNIFVGTVAAPTNPSAMHLKWFILNWTDSDRRAADGISGIDPVFFNIPTLVGLQIANNNNLSEMPFPAGIVNMDNLENLALNLGNESPSDGWLSGSLPKGFGTLSHLRFARLNGHKNLTIDFDVIDLSSMSSLRNIVAPSCDIRGVFPDYFLDGTMPKLAMFNLNFPSGSGMTGQFPSFVATGDENHGYKVINIGYGNHISGAIPSSLWNRNYWSLINTEFHGNNLTSLGTADLTKLSNIRNLRFGDNNIGPEKWPNLAWGTDKLKDFTRADFSGNRYVFSNMLWKPSNGGGKTIFELYKAKATRQFNYGNQQPFGQSRTITISAGSTITIDDFDSVVTHPDNVYQWQKDGENIAGATSRTLTISSAKASDAGTYRLVVTNPGVPSLTLTSKPVELRVNY